MPDSSDLEKPTRANQPEPKLKRRRTNILKESRELLATVAEVITANKQAPKQEVDPIALLKQQQELKKLEMKLFMIKAAISLGVGIVLIILSGLAYSTVTGTDIKVPSYAIDFLKSLKDILITILGLAK